MKWCGGGPPPSIHSSHVYFIMIDIILWWLPIVRADCGHALRVLTSCFLSRELILIFLQDMHTFYFHSCLYMCRLLALCFLSLAATSCSLIFPSLDTFFFHFCRHKYINVFKMLLYNRDMFIRFKIFFYHFCNIWYTYINLLKMRLVCGLAKKKRTFRGQDHDHITIKNNSFVEKREAWGWFCSLSLLVCTSKREWDGCSVPSSCERWESMSFFLLLNRANSLLKSTMDDNNIFNRSFESRRHNLKRVFVFI